MGGYPEEGMPLLATVDPVWIRCGCAVGVPKAVYACISVYSPAVVVGPPPVLADLPRVLAGPESWDLCP